MTLDKAPIEVLYDAQVTLKPTRLKNTALDMAEIPLETTNKTLPGIEAAEIITISTDSPSQEVAKKIVGKLGGLTQMDFQVVHDPLLQSRLVDHAGTQFDVIITYDNASLDEIVVIIAHDCFLVTPGSTSSSQNNAFGPMTVSLQGKGGKKLRDCLEVQTAERPTTPPGE
ncbi:MAG TPA: hypothetical protein DEB39_09305 [Planctomycetaceae bacterium]|nr:hypothetical protein [Planctomycetaceae bacterium]